MTITEKDKDLMREAIRLSEESVMNGGGPFGAVIAKDGKVVAGASNSVTLQNDPTAHAEVACIREACRQLGTFDLSGCTIYTSCEPCPMCLGAIYWARPKALYFAADRKRAAASNFDDEFIYKEVPLPTDKRSLKTACIQVPGSNLPFDEWDAKTDKTEY